LSDKKYFPKVYKVFYNDDSSNRTQFFVLSEFIRGDSLSSYVKNITSQKDMDKLKNNILEILTYFCENNIVHNDFHMNNIMIVYKGKDDYDLKVLDFGYTIVRNKCKPYVELLKFISYLYGWKINDKFADMMMKYFLDNYLKDEEVFEKCLDVKNKKKIITDNKGFTRADIKNYLDKKDYTNFSSKCYLSFWNDIKTHAVPFLNFKNPVFNYYSNSDVVKINLNTYKDKFVKLFD
jgi:tRNA A-37 threonylcarbamoyl transferase component Bud32